MAASTDDNDNKCFLQDIADAYDHIRQIYEIYSSSFSYPCDHNITIHDLNTVAGVQSYLGRLSNGHGPLFPYQTHVCSLYEGYPVYDSTLYISLPALTSREINDFLNGYAETVPHIYHDDIAILIQALRDNLWINRGSGGGCYLLDNGMRATIKFSKIHNYNKRVKSGRLQADELVLRQALIQKRQQLEAEKQEKERRQKEDEARILRERLAEEQREREQQRKLDEEARLLRESLAKEQRERQMMLQQQQEYRYALATKCVNKLKTQIATPDSKESAEILRIILETNLRRYSGDNTVSIHIFGSFASGLCSITSDVDFTVYNFARHYKNPIEELAKALRWSKCQSVTTIANARVPIVSFKAQTFDCDMNIDQPMGVLNSKLIATYSKIDNRFVQLWFGVRHLAKKHGILSGSTGYLSSYALVMMLIVFLQDVTKPPMLPKLQQREPRQMVAYSLEGHDCSFDRGWSNYRTFASRNTKSTGELFIDFCRFYGFQFNYATQEVNPRFGAIQPRSFSPPQHNSTGSQPKVWSMCILDPFVCGRNVAGNCRNRNVVQIQQCFQTAYKALIAGNPESAFKTK
ncbi:hypothetical protein EC991_006522 [Linnemannia zychae]|nr:hypothetical protein EC991_006522 [Linnemannia zychae]